MQSSRKHNAVTHNEPYSHIANEIYQQPSPPHPRAQLSSTSPAPSKTLEVFSTVEDLASPKWLVLKRALKACRPTGSVRALSGASSRGQGPSSRALATVLWHLTLQVFIFLERASLWKIRIIHWFWHTLLSRPTTEALFLIYVKFSDQIKINLFWGCFFYKIAFLQECYWSRKSIYYSCTTENTESKIQNVHKTTNKYQGFLLFSGIVG